MDPRKKIKTLWLIFALMEVALLVLGGFLVMENEKAMAKVIESARNIHDLRLKVLSYDKIKVESDELGDAGDKLEKRFTNKESAVDFIKKIEEAAVESGVKIRISLFEVKAPAKSKKEREKEKAKAAAQKEEEKPLSFMIETESDYSSLVKFVVKLENLAKYDEIVKVDVMHVSEKQAAPLGTGVPGEPIEPEMKEYSLGKILIFAR